MASYPERRTRVPASETPSGAFWMVATMLLGFAVAVVAFFALMMWADARESRDSAAAQPAASEGAAATSGHDATDHNTALPLNSFAGVVPENATELRGGAQGQRRGAAASSRR